MLRLRLLGGLSLESDGRPLDTESHRRALVVLAVIATAANGGMSRDKLLAYFWPESDESRARQALRQRFFALRRELGVDDLFLGTNELRLNPEVITTDIAELDAALVACDAERAAELHRGALLDGVHIKQAPELEHWLDAQRDRLTARVKKAFTDAAALASERGRLQDAARWWRRVVALDPASADATHALVTALVATGETASAFQHLRVYEKLMREEYGVEPDARVLALAEHLRAAPGPPAVPSLEAPRPAPIAPHAADVVPEQPSVRGDRRVRWGRRPVVVAGIGLLGAVGVAVAAAKHRPDVENRRVVVAAFENRTGDRSLDPLGYMAADWVAQALQSTRLVEVVDPATAMLASNHARRERVRGGEESEVRLMSKETRAGLVVTGSYYRAGDSLVMVARVSEPRGQELIDATDPERFHATNPEPVLDRVRQRVLGLLALRIDERLVPIVPAGSTTPPTYEAYSAYMEGMTRFQKRDYAQALPYLQQAYALDTTFTHALVWQGWTLANLRGPRATDSIVAKLTEVQHRLPPLDRMAVDYFRASASRDRQAMLAAASAAARLAPGSHWVYNAASALSELGRFDEAIRTFEQVDRGTGWTRGWFPYWERYTTALHFGNEYDRALELARETRRVFPNDPWPLFWQARALAAMRRTAQMDRVVAELRAATLPPDQFSFGALLSELGWELDMKGDSAAAQRVYDDGIAWFRALPPDRPDSLRRRGELTSLLYRAGRWSEAKRLLERSLAKIPAERWADERHACILARGGERARAEQELAAILSDTSTRASEQTFGRAARVAACLGDRDRAVEYIRRHNVRHRNRPYVLYVKGVGLHPQHTERDHRDFDTLLDYPPYRAVRLLTR